MNLVVMKVGISGRSVPACPLCNTIDRECRADIRDNVFGVPGR